MRRDDADKVMRNANIFGALIGLLVALLLIALLLGAVSAANAQEATPESPIVVSIQQPENTVTIPADTFTNNQNTNAWINLGDVVLIALAAGGSFAVVLNHLTKQNKDTIERAYQGLSSEWQGVITRTVDIAEKTANAAQSLVHIAKQVTDGKPNTDEDVFSLVFELPDGTDVTPEDIAVTRAFIKQYFENKPSFQGRLNAREKVNRPATCRTV